jgi:hypothetical protein
MEKQSKRLENVQKQCINKYDNKKRKKKEIKTERISVRCTPRDKELLRIKAKGAGLDQADFIIKVITNEKIFNLNDGLNIARKIASLELVLQNIETTLAVKQVHPDYKKYVKARRKELDMVKDNLIERLLTSKKK